MSASGGRVRGKITWRWLDLAVARPGGGSTWRWLDLAPLDPILKDSAGRHA